MTRQRKKQQLAEPSPQPDWRRWTDLAEDGAAGAFLLALLLAFRLDIRDHFALPKLAVFQAGTLVLWVLVALNCLRGRCRRPPRSVGLLLAGLAAWWVLSTVTAAHAPTALWGNYGRYQGLWTQLTLACLFVVFATRPVDVARVDRLMALLALALAPVALYALAQHAGYDVVPWIKGDNRSASTMGQPVLLAAALSVGVPPLLGFALRSRGPARAGWLGLLVVLGAGAFSALSRGPLLGLASSLVVFGLLAPGGALRVRARVLAAAAAVTLLALLIVLLLGGGARFAGRLASPEIGQRLVFFRAAARIIADSPLVGVGFGNFSVVYPRYRLPEDNRHGADQLPTMVHNGYLQTAVSSGIPALALYLGLAGLVLAGLIRVARSDRPASEGLTAAAIAASLGGYLVQDLSGWSDPGLTPLLWVLLGVGSSLLPPVPSSRRLPAWAGRALLAAVALTMLFPLVRSRRLLEADRLFFEAARFERDSGFLEIDSRLSEALELVRGNPHYSEEASLRYLEVYAATGEPRAYRRAAELCARSLREDPNNPYPHVNRLRLEAAALRRGDAGAEPPEVAAAVGRLPAMDPNNPSGYVAAAEYLIARGDHGGAVPLLEKAGTLRLPEAREANLLADAYRRLGRHDEAQLHFKKATRISGGKKNPSRQDIDDWLASSYGLAMTLSAKNEYNGALVVVGEALKKFPDRAYSYKVQAAIYEAKGDRESARAALARYRDGGRP